MGGGESSAGLHLAPDGAIDQDFTCLRCQYNLRGLKRPSDCPECGLAIERSIELKLLHLTDPAWLRAVAASSVWITVGVIGVLGYVGFALLSDYDPSRNGQWTIGGGLFLSVGLVTCVIGFWLATKPMRVAWRPVKLERRRKLTRITMMIAWPMVPLAIWTTKLAPTWAGSMTLGVLFLLIVGLTAALSYAAQLAAQINHRTLLWQARLIALGFVLCCAAGWALGALMYTTPRLPGGNHYYPPLSAMRYIGGALVALALWTLAMLTAYGRRFRQAALLADQMQSSALSNSHTEAT